MWKTYLKHIYATEKRYHVAIGVRVIYNESVEVILIHIKRIENQMLVRNMNE